MRHGLALLAFAATTCVFAAPPAERPNQLVFRSGPWFVVRSEKDGGTVVACTGFYRANRHVQLNRDTLIIRTTEEMKDVAFAFDGQPAGPHRAPSAAEKELKAIVFTGEDFAKLTHSHGKLRIDMGTAQGTMRHELDLTGLPAALENIEKGCPAPQDAKPVRRRHRS